ncbi:alpha-ketoglutarate-dependent dioxygenase AlkB family protein [Haliea sp. E17]|uniref:alpha-ketoglutarate-dependent dioxygenase AlkB family protein n=1 Tax=Haliea sp. E17 TaxID=3401576 RepID=UPI003AAE6781
MDLFDQQELGPVALIAKDGDVAYHGILLPPAEADHHLAGLLHDIDWRRDEAVIFGRHILTKRKIAWYGNKPFSYTYSNTTRVALPWTSQLLQLKRQVETHTGETFNSCLLNLYHDGSEGMAWHCDEEVDLKKNGAIASLSFGAERKFCFKHKRSAEVISVVLQHGSLLVMQGSTQSHWLHRLPPSRKIREPRVNLTFRTIVE